MAFLITYYILNSHPHVRFKKTHFQEGNWVRHRFATDLRVRLDITPRLFPLPGISSFGYGLPLLHSAALPVFSLCWQAAP